MAINATVGILYDGQGTVTNDDLETVWGSGSSPVNSLVGILWESADTPVSQVLDLVWSASPTVQNRTAVLFWASSIATRNLEFSLSWKSPAAINRDHALLWAAADNPLNQPLALAWPSLTAINSYLSVAWPSFTAINRQLALLWQPCNPINQASGLVWASVDAPRGQALEILWGFDGRIYKSLGLLWGPVNPVNRGYHTNWYSNHGTISMNFDVTLKRVSDNAVIDLESCSLGLDRRDWSWSFSASTPKRAVADLVLPTASGPVEIELDAFGFLWRFLIEDVASKYQFGSRNWTMSGRSLSSVLAAPYDSPQTTTWNTAKNARQIVQEVLDGSGWAEIWNIADWTIPAGALSVVEKTRMEILNQIATAVGGVVQSDPATKQLSFEYHYPASPKTWGTATPAKTVGEDVTADLGSRWSPQPGYDYVVVAGRDQGVMVHVKRDGAPQLTLAPTIIDPLIGAEIAGRERGRYLLDAQGYDRRIYPVKLPFPLPGNGPGLILPGQLLEIGLDGEWWRGQVDNIKLDFSNEPSSWLTTEIERVSL